MDEPLWKKADINSSYYLGMFWLTRRELISALFITRVTGVLDGFCTSNKKIMEEENNVEVVIISQENGPCYIPVQNGEKNIFDRQSDLKFENKDTDKITVTIRSLRYCMKL